MANVQQITALDELQTKRERSCENAEKSGEISFGIALLQII